MKLEQITRLVLLFTLLGVWVYFLLSNPPTQTLTIISVLTAFELMRI
jgi:hypothetical protein